MGKWKSKFKKNGLSSYDNRAILNRLLRVSNVCGICGEQIINRKDASIDHVIPIGRGGHDSIENMQPAHVWCNNIKSDSLPEEFEVKENGRQLSRNARIGKHQKLAT
jgi:5-methylcytosine-specific restriction endonuclease McrA